MEQRNGRIDRHGQKAKKSSSTISSARATRTGRSRLADPVGDLEADLEFLMRAVRKVEQIREDLGKVGPVIAEQVEDAMLGRRVKLDTAKAEKDAEPVRGLARGLRRSADARLWAGDHAALGAVLIMLDTELQERPIPNTKMPVPGLTRPRPPIGDSAALMEAAKLLAAAKVR